MATHTVFVCGATGAQGGALARQLRALNWEVRTITRNTNSAAAQSLASIGVKVHEGSWSDRVALEAAISGCDLLFLNLLPDLTNFTAELEDGTTVLAVAKAAGIQHVVYSTSIPLPEDKTDPNSFAAQLFQPKKQLEQAIQTAGFPRWTILRPGAFMSNYLPPMVNLQYPGATETGVFTMALLATTMLPMIDTEDIGKFAVAAFQHPDRFHAQVVLVVSESLSVEEGLETMRRVLGRPNIRGKYLDGKELQAAKATNPILGMQELLRHVDVFEGADAREAAKKWGVETGTFEEFVKREKKVFDEAYRNV
ncbi:hypothetical protein CHGG_03532 [Chaetomium globosum CBS 148.51]|uniref:NmrA-like domain-containing protein n=1 Tax=Chaetomium globosum (strain ATCC 6205 / CBS 148.51 / DSM 1962 / NBRC 6347 / NRRL 1970) TaxID=306901 RepID=Q2H8C2_CHAGB|nr:uncharacterized protein CHGG_03532 [Chaetomium globosum CBS 148.51]EAQ91597.1 hypothetical protein CHGG_03532 [Chaetomium globosum CBS 148.51]